MQYPTQEERIDTRPPPDDVGAPYRVPPAMPPPPGPQRAPDRAPTAAPGGE